MDGPSALVTLHDLDPAFRQVCEALFPGLEPAAVAAQVYKAEPGSSDLHVPSPVWRNGRGDTKGRGRRKIDTDVKRIVHKADRDKLERRVGLATTGVGTTISAVALPKHLRTLPSALRQTKTGPSVSEGVKNAVKTVRSFTAPAEAVQNQRRSIRTGLGAVREGAAVLRENPKIGAGLVLGATGLHTANLTGEAIATKVIAGHKKQASPGGITKAWETASGLIVGAYQRQEISKAQALDWGKRAYAELAKVYAPSPARSRCPSGPQGTALRKNYSPSTALQAPTKLTALKAPNVQPVTPGPRPATLAATPKKKKPVKKVEKSGIVRKDEPTIDIEGEIAKRDDDKQQIFGWASVVKVDGVDWIDKQADLIDIDEIENAAYDFVLNSRIGGDMHGKTGRANSEMIESFVFTPDKISKLGLPDSFPQGWWVGMQVRDPEVWADIKQGRRKGFSIHGVGHREPMLVPD
jgi:hypothetical protein